MQFDQLGLHTSLVSQLTQLGIEKPTSAQSLTIPRALGGQNLLVQAKTGSGKTLAFVLPFLQKKLSQKVQTQAALSTLILCPTRELAEQVADQCRAAAKAIPNYKVLTVYGGVPIGHQIASLKHIPDVIVGTPGRIIDILDKTSISLASIDTLVLDEADRMLDMGFEDQMQQIFDALARSKSRYQTLMFSATVSAQIEQIARHRFTDPQIIRVEETEAHTQIKQIAWELMEDRQFYAVASLLTEHQPSSCIVFCNTKIMVDKLFDYLLQHNFDAVALHGDMQQSLRDNAIRAFKSSCANILIASDVAARGLDIDNVDLVISADVSPDIDTHIHRIGRTGRADNEGLAAILFEPVQANHIEKLADATRQPIPKKKMQALRFHSNRIVKAPYRGVLLNAGKKQKINKVDIVGALTQQGNIAADDLGKIFVTAQSSFVAIKIRSVKPALRCLQSTKIKGKKVNARTI